MELTFYIMFRLKFVGVFKKSLMFKLPKFWLNVKDVTKGRTFLDNIFDSFVKIQY